MPPLGWRKSENAVRKKKKRPVYDSSDITWQNADLPYMAGDMYGGGFDGSMGSASYVDPVPQIPPGVDPLDMPLPSGATHDASDPTQYHEDPDDGAAGVGLPVTTGSALEPISSGNAYYPALEGPVGSAPAVATSGGGSTKTRGSLSAYPALEGPAGSAPAVATSGGGSTKMRGSLSAYPALEGLVGSAPAVATSGGGSTKTRGSLSAYPALEGLVGSAPAVATSGGGSTKTRGSLSAYPGLEGLVGSAPAAVDRGSTKVGSGRASGSAARDRTLNSLLDSIPAASRQPSVSKRSAKGSLSASSKASATSARSIALSLPSSGRYKTSFDPAQLIDNPLFETGPMVGEEMPDFFDTPYQPRAQLASSDSLTRSSLGSGRIKSYIPVPIPTPEPVLEDAPPLQLPQPSIKPASLKEPKLSKAEERRLIAMLKADRVRHQGGEAEMEHLRRNLRGPKKEATLAALEATLAGLPAKIVATETKLGRPHAPLHISPTKAKPRAAPRQRR